MAFGCFCNLWCFQILYILLVFSLLGGMAAAKVMLIGSNVSLSVDDVEANFGPSINGSGECGILYLADPLDACSSLLNKVIPGQGASSPFVLMIRGGCTFDDKVRSAQSAGFKAVIIFDDEDGALVAMAGNPAGIKIPAVFVSRTSGEILKKYASLTDMELWITPTFENLSWSIMALSFISLLAMSAVLATCFFVRKHRRRREQRRPPHVREFHGMSRRLVKAMPSLIFTSALEDNCTSRTCAICLEDYSVGEKLRVLPCRHKFHAVCVDSWLTTWRTFCPICKRDARTSTGDLPASESTPLLSSGSIPSAFSSVHSSLATSSPIQIVPLLRSAALSSPCSSRETSSVIQIPPGSFHSPSTSQARSRSSTHYMLQSVKTCSRSPTISVSRSYVDLRNAASSHMFRASYVISPNSLGLPSLSSPLNSQYASPFVPSSSNGSPIYIGSSSMQQFNLHCSHSAASISPFASARSLPGC